MADVIWVNIHCKRHDEEVPPTSMLRTGQRVNLECVLGGGGDLWGEDISEPTNRHPDIVLVAQDQQGKDGAVRMVGPTLQEDGKYLEMQPHVMTPVK